MVKGVELKVLISSYGGYELILDLLFQEFQSGSGSFDCSIPSSRFCPRMGRKECERERQAEPSAGFSLWVQEQLEHSLVPLALYIEKVPVGLEVHVVVIPNDANASCRCRYVMVSDHIDGIW